MDSKKEGDVDGECDLYSIGAGMGNQRSKKFRSWF